LADAARAGTADVSTARQMMTESYWQFVSGPQAREQFATAARLPADRRCSGPCAPSSMTCNCPARPGRGSVLPSRRIRRNAPHLRHLRHLRVRRASPRRRTASPQPAHQRRCVPRRPTAGSSQIRLPL
jgi:hypothetical protein